VRRSRFPPRETMPPLPIKAGSFDSPASVSMKACDRTIVPCLGLRERVFFLLGPRAPSSSSFYSPDRQPSFVHCPCLAAWKDVPGPGPKWFFPMKRACHRRPFDTPSTT